MTIDLKDIDTPKSCNTCRFGINKSIPLEVAVVCSFNGEWALDKECDSLPPWCPFKEAEND